MKVIIQIPCFNEEESLPITLAALPRTLPGVESVEWMVVDDGSTDRTLEVAMQLGVDHVVRLKRHQGLAQAFLRGITYALRQGADVIVNTDADNQYCANDMGKLISPILANDADIVIGARPIMQTAHFSLARKMLQKLGSWVVRVVSGTSVLDAPCGFRAFSREAALSIHIFTRYSYTIETIIQAGQNGYRILSVPIRTNGDLRPSRLLHSTLHYILHSSLTIFRVFVIYYPLAYFSSLGIASLIMGILLGLRFLFYYLTHHGNGHVQSLLLCVIFVIIAFILFSLAVLGELAAVNRKLLEKIESHLNAPDVMTEHVTN